MRKAARRWLAVSSLSLSFALASCADAPDPGTRPYTYLGCEDKGAQECPGREAFVCAMDLITKSHARCQRSQDCTPGGHDAGLFPADCIDPCLLPAVAASEEQDFIQEAKEEIYKYCQAASCIAYLGCPRPANAELACVDGGCAWIEGIWRLPDAGPPRPPGRDASSPPPPGPDASTRPPPGRDASSPPPPGPDASTPPPPGPDASAPPPGPDAAAPPGPDASAPPGPDASAAPPGLDAAAPAGLDAS